MEFLSNKMSLLNSASAWNHTEKRKKIPSMKKPSLNMYNNSQENTLMIEGFKTNIPGNIEKTQKDLEERNSKVHDLIDKLTSEDNENSDGNNLENFNPLPKPNIHVKKDLPPIQQNNLEYNPNQHQVFSSYNKIYNGEMVYNNESKYAPHINKISKRMGIPVNSNDKLMEKLNYMIHMLEQQQHEKTENITEEFILYSFLGIFVIYIVDSFSRTGKYIR